MFYYFWYNLLNEPKQTKTGDYFGTVTYRQVTNDLNFKIKSLVKLKNYKQKEKSRVLEWIMSFLIHLLL